ncbi:hypothetical protein ACVBEF_14650 [Glaciimonas sp. GG7]
MKILTPKNKRNFLWMLIFGAIIRTIFLYFTQNLNAALWVGFCFLGPIWITYALFYNKDMYGPFSWNNGENQVGRVGISIFNWGIYLLLIFKNF